MFIAGAAVQWLRDGLGLDRRCRRVRAPRAQRCRTAGGVFLVPAFTGLGAPHWRPEARGALLGLTRGTTRAHVCRAALEAMAYQTATSVAAMRADVEAAGTTPRRRAARGRRRVAQRSADAVPGRPAGLAVDRPARSKPRRWAPRCSPDWACGFWSERRTMLRAARRTERRFAPRLGCRGARHGTSRGLAKRRCGASSMRDRLRGSRRASTTWSSSAAASTAPAWRAMPRCAAAASRWSRKTISRSGASSPTRSSCTAGVRYLEQGDAASGVGGLPRARAPAAPRAAPGATAALRLPGVPRLAFRPAALARRHVALRRCWRRSATCTGIACCRRAAGGDWGEGLRRDGLRGAALLLGCRDGRRAPGARERLAARAAGAVTLNRVTVLERLLSGGRRVAGVAVRDRKTGPAARGPWRARVVAVRRAVDERLPGARARRAGPLAPTRGTHIVVRRLAERAFTLAAGSDGRVFFVLPWMGATLIGTTDSSMPAIPDAVAPAETRSTTCSPKRTATSPRRACSATTCGGVRGAAAACCGPAAAASARSREHALLEPVPGSWWWRAANTRPTARWRKRWWTASKRPCGSRRPCRTARYRCRAARSPGAPEHWDRGPRFAPPRRAWRRAHGVDRRPRSAARIYGTTRRRSRQLIAADAGLARRCMRAARPASRSSCTRCATRWR